MSKESHYLRQIEELKEENARLKEMAFFDKLTGAYNRNFGQEELKKQCSNSRQPVTIAFIDIVNFKIINDFGNYEMGDQFLKTTTSVLQQTVRSSDYIIRWGGDEFLLIFPNCGENQKENLEEKIKKVGNDIGLDLSVGFATKKIGEKYIDNDIKDFVKKAEIVMKSQKTQTSRKTLARVYS